MIVYNSWSLGKVWSNWFDTSTASLEWSHDMVTSTAVIIVVMGSVHALIPRDRGHGKGRNPLGELDEN